MPRPKLVSAVAHCLRTAIRVSLDLACVPLLAARSHSALVAENLFLRKQLALFQERKTKPRRADDSIRWLMATLSRFFPWRGAQVNVKADTLTRWHRRGSASFGVGGPSRQEGPPLPKDLRQLIREMAVENVTWGEERIADELKLKLGIRVSPRTVGKYLRQAGPRRAPDPQQRWLTFVRNHAKAIVACDFFTVVTISFRTLYVFVILEVGTRRILHHAVTAHPTAERTLQQFREALPDDHCYRFVLHDWDRIFWKELDRAVTDMGVRVLRTPVRAPKANSIGERLGGSLRCECLDFFIPFSECHVRAIVRLWVKHYSRRRLPVGFRVVKTSVLGGLHHEYSLVKEPA